MIRILSKFLNRIIIFVTLVALCTCVIFVSFNRPVKVKAEAISAIALGGGALAAVLGSYLITSGVQLAFDGGTDSTLTDYFNSIKMEYENQTANYNTYFNDQGQFIGTEEDLSLFVSDQGMAYWNMGKDAEAWFEGLKDWFVSENSLSVDSTTSLANTNYFVSNGVSYPFLIRRNPYSSYPASLVSSSDTSYNYLIGNNTFSISESFNDSSHIYSLTVSVKDSSNNILYNNTKTVSNLGSSYSTFKSQHNVNFISDASGNFFIGAIKTSSSTDSLSIYGSHDINSYMDSITFADMSVEGSLTDGYQDFQDAINQDKTAVEDNADAVFGLGVDLPVGTDTSTLTADQIREIILSLLLSGELVGTYEGVYENVDTAEEEQTEEQTDTPTTPEGWVIINGLEDFFPFCIPWDLYSLISLLNVPPEAPSFTYSISTGGIFEDEEIEVDLSTFDTVAQVFRIMMIIGFVAFLIIKTRDMIRG